MAMWYYAEAGSQKGPVSDTEFEELARSGRITPETLVWREGMDNWQPYARTQQPVMGAVAVDPSMPETAVGACSQCGRSFAQEDMIHYGDSWVCAACKPFFFQKLREGVQVSGSMEYAGFWIRLVAKLIDRGILWVVSMILTFASSSVNEDSPAVFAPLMLNLIINMAYYIGFVGKTGATPGKMSMKLKIVTADGEPVSYLRATGRFFAEILSGLLLGIGYIIAAFDDEKRTLHDRICGTRVIRQ